METISLKGPAVIDGAVRYPVEGALIVSDDVALRLRAADLVDEDADHAPADDDGLDAMKVADLQATATDEGVDLQGATLKADIIAAIRAHRAPAA